MGQPICNLSNNGQTKVYTTLQGVCIVSYIGTADMGTANYYGRMASYATGDLFSIISRFLD